MEKFDYLVVGSGLYGSIFAHEAKAHGKSVLVVDKRPNIAGNIYTENIEGINVHKYGAHIFHTNNKKVWNYITQFAEFNRFTNSPVANYKGELYSLPFNMYTFNKMWGVVTPEEAAAKIEEQRKEITGEPQNLEEQAISLVGRDIYEKLVKGYTEKQWGRDCKELPSFIIKRLPVRLTFDNNYFNALYQGIPVGGYTKMIANLLDGIEVCLNTDYLENMTELDALADKVVYTGPIDAYFDYKLGTLEYRSVRFETEVLDVYLAYSLRPQTPKNYKDFLNQRVHLIEMKNVGVKGLTNLKSDIAAIKELRQIEKDVQPDVIHLHSSVAGGLGRLAYKGKNNTVVYTPHGYAHILMGPGKKSKVYKFAEKVLGNRALTLTCCESEDEEAKKFSKRTAYVETGVNLADLSTSLDGIKPVKNDRFTVFTLGRACVQKQPQLFNKIAELVPDARFVWIGNGELENELKAPNIEVTGWKPRKEALAMAKGADAFILCSLGEAIAMSLIENMYIKKLILVSNTMGNKSVIRDGINGYVCDKAEEYAAHIKAAMNDFPKELPERAYQDVLKIYNTDAMKKKYIAFYNDVIAGKY